MNLRRNKRSINFPISDNEIQVAENLEKSQGQKNFSQNQVNESMCKYLPQDLISQLNLEDTLAESQGLIASHVSHVSKPKISSTSNDIPEVDRMKTYHYPQDQDIINQCNYNARPFMQLTSVSTGQRYLLMPNCYPEMAISGFNRAIPAMQLENLGISQTEVSRPLPGSCKVAHQRKIEEQIGLSIICQKKALSYNPPKRILKEDSSNDPQPELQYIEAMKMPIEGIMSVIKTQIGSIALQKMLETLSNKEIQLLIEKISGNIKEIMCDHYGNYFMQKLIYLCKASQRIFLLKSVLDCFLEIAITASGSHSIQSFIDNCTEEEEEKLLIACIEKHILKLSCNSNGTHIIQKIISRFEENKRDFLNICLMENMKKLCRNAHGLCVIKKFISANRETCITQKLISILEEESIAMSEDQYGNYVIQHAIEVYGVELCGAIIRNVIASLLKLSNQKFSSNVVEKIIFILAKYQRDEFSAILNEMFIKSMNFRALFKNKYGYFVLTNTIRLMTPQHRMQIKDHLIRNICVNGAKEKQKLLTLLKQMN